MSKKKKCEMAPPGEGGECVACEGAPEAEAVEAAVEEAGASPGVAAETEEERLKDRLLRLQADFDNYRKRMAREFIENREQASKDVMEAMLTPLDHLDHALSSLAKTAGEQDPSYQGVRLVRTEFRSVMERFGLKGIETLGKAFDPTLHEALGAVPSAEAKEGDVVIEVRAGYMLGNRVLRAAQVMVAQ